ncbi:hypothetical protein FACS1894164_13220 [Spirochaetia bacterium]|nr:hypothetical protein FACS1894164_13220 [Spirochaetia bacterium]
MGCLEFPDKLSFVTPFAAYPGNIIVGVIMKKWCTVLIFGMCLSGAAFAEFPDKLSFVTPFATYPGTVTVGAILGGGFNPAEKDGDNNVTRGYGIAGFTLELSVLPKFEWALKLDMGADYFRFMLRGDYRFIDSSLWSAINLNWYFGAGAYLFFGNDAFGMGLRAPIGLSWQFLDRMEFRLGTDLNLGFKVIDPVFDFFMDFELGFRVKL